MTEPDGIRETSLLSQAPQEEDAFLELARTAPFVYGPWRDVKRLYKEAEPAGSAEVLGILIGRLDAEDTRNRTTPTTADPLELGRVFGMAVEGSHAYLTTEKGLTVLDISTPASPRIAGALALGRCGRIVLAGRTAYVAQGAGEAPDRVYFVDVSDPAHPREVDGQDVRRLRGFAVEGPHLYVVEGAGPRRGMLRIFDVSVPVRPVHLGSLDLPDAADLVLAGARAYVSTQAGNSSTGDLYVVDLADPRNPVSLGIVPTKAAGVLIGGRFLQGSPRSQLLWVVDEAALQAPPPSPALAQPGLLERVAEFMSRAAGNPADKPGAASRLALPHTVVDLERRYPVDSAVVHRGHAYLTGYSGIMIYALSGSEALRRVGEIAWRSHAVMAAAGDYLYMFSGSFGLEVFEVSRPARPLRMGAPPSAETMEYMRRRGRRVLRRMAEQDPARFAEVAFHALVQSGRGRSELNTRQQWVSVDLLYGASGRFTQNRHGRGACVPRWTGLRRREREERCPAAWDRRLDLAGTLYAASDLPWQTQETMLKVLQANRAELPALEEAACLRFLQSPSPLLVREAVRSVAPALEAGERVESKLAAPVFFFAGGALRKRLATRLAERAGSPGWARPFASILFGLLATRIGDGRASGRVAAAAELLSRNFSPFLPSDRLLALAERLFLSGRQELSRLGLAGFRTVSDATVAAWLEVWSRLPAEHQAPAWDVLVAALRRATLSTETARKLVNAGEDAARQAGWRLLQALSATPALLAVVWEELLASEEETLALRSALTSLAALDLLQSSGLRLESLADRVSRTPALVEVMPPEAVELLTASLPADGVVCLIAAISETRWPSLRGSVLRGLLRSGHVAAFWKAVPAAPIDLSIQRRLLEDPEFAGSFLGVDDPSLLEITDPPFEALLRQWLETHPGLLPPGSPALLTAATHPLPAARDWALARVREAGMDLPFALRLLESAVPPSMALGRSFFESVSPGDPAGLPHTLALCDSPDRAVRAIGRELIQARRATLLTGELIGALAEHGDAEMNRFLADLLRVTEPGFVRPEVPEFDRGVLRARNRGRRAKEAVKARLDETAAPDLPLLLELARGGTPRDAEWALSQLARLAAEGRVVEGMMLEGVAGV